MRVLLDEDIPHRLRLQFPPGHEVETVEYRGWKGLKNGALLRIADPHFDVLVTLDSNIPEQQNLKAFQLGIIVLRARTNRLVDILGLMPMIAEALANSVGRSNHASSRIAVDESADRSSVAVL